MLGFSSWFGVSGLGGSTYFESLWRGRQKRLRKQRQSRWESRLIETLEDRSLLTVVDFSTMIAEVTAVGDDGDVITAFLTGSASIDVADTPTQTPDGRDTVDTEIVAMNLQGFDSYNGPLSVTVSSILPSVGGTAERRNTVPGAIDTDFQVDSFFDVFLEIEAFVEDPFNPMQEIQVTLYGTATVETGDAGGSGVPVAGGDTMTLIEPFALFLDPFGTMPAGFTVEELDLTFEADFTSISGQKWNDLDGDGVKDLDEPGLDNWIIVALDLSTNLPVEAAITRSVDLDMSGTIEPETESGLFEFNTLPPGRYFITEMQQTGWDQTFPLSVPAGELPQFGPGGNWLQFVREGNDFLTVGMLLTFDWNNDGSGDEVVFVEGDAGVFVGNYDSMTDSAPIEVSEFDLYGMSTRGPVHLVTGDPVANLMNDGSLHLGGSFTQDPADPTLADSFFDIFVQLDVGNPLGRTPNPSTIWTNTTPIRVESKVDRLPPLGLPYQMTNAGPVPFFDIGMDQQAQIVDLRFTNFRPELFNETVGYFYTVTQGQEITNVLFGNHDAANGPFGVDYGDADDQLYPTLASQNGANHVIDGKHFLGLRVDAEDDGQPNEFAAGDDLNDPPFALRSDDEDGVLFLTPLVTGETANIVVQGSRLATQQMLLSAWVDWNGNGDWSDVGDHVFTDEPILPGSNQLTIDVPAGAVAGLTTARFRVSTGGGLSFTGGADDGEVEDYAVVVYSSDPGGLDWGDAPDPLDATPGKYPTLAANGGAYHAIDGVTVIGNFIDAEADGQPTAGADGDDLNGLVDDEDGIVVRDPLAVGEGGNIDVYTLIGGFLNAWIDFNADGDWDDPGEQIYSDFPVGPGRNTLFVDVPGVDEGVEFGETFARFRLSPNPGEVAGPFGGAVNENNPGGVGFGEVEDIALTIYHGELTAEELHWEIAAQPQAVPPAIDEADSGDPVGIVALETHTSADDTVELLNQEWYWFAIDGGTPQRLDTLTLVDASPQFQNPLMLTYGDVLDGDPIQVELTITLNETSVLTASYSTSVAITNLTGAPIDVDFWSYTDLDLNGALGRFDRGTVVSTSQITVTGITGTSVSHQITGTLADHYQIGTVSTDGTAFAFQNGTNSDLTDSPGVGMSTGPGNIAHAFQWSRTVGAGATLTLDASNGGTAVPAVLPQTNPGGSVVIGLDNAGSGTGGSGGTGGSATGGSSRFGGPGGAGVGTPQSFDPAFALGYDYDATVNRFATVQLPTGVGDDEYTVSYLDDMAVLQTVTLMGGVELNFDDDPNVANGVDSFRVLGVETSEMIDVEDPLGFVTLLSFVTNGPFSHTQTGIPEFIYVAEGAGQVREDTDIGGMLGVLQDGDAATWLPGTEHAESGLTFGYTVFDSVTDAQNFVTANGYTGLSELVAPPLDFGDAPDTGASTGTGNYQTTEADGGPSHLLNSSLFLGANVDFDSGTLRNVAANADDVDGALPDDEDGVLSPFDLRGTEGAAPTVTLMVTNNSGSAATLAGWIDFNGDGVFDDSTERATTTVVTGTMDTRVTLTFPAVPDGSAGNTYARFRLSTDAAFVANPTSTGAAADGEVEDYAFAITVSGDGTVASSVKIASSTNGGPALADADFFGRSITSLGDLDGDGVADLAVGARGDDSAGYARGAVHVLLLNADGTVKSSTKIASSTNGGPALADSDFFGTAVAAIGDLDGDGVMDLAVGGNGDDTGGGERGAVHVLLLNADGTVKGSTKIASGTNGGPTLMDQDFFGVAVASIGDLNGDGVQDLVVGAMLDDTGGQNRGAVYVLMMNADGTVESSTKIASGTNGGPTLTNQDFFGFSVTAVGDLDGDGVTDLAVGTYADDTGGSDRGAVYVLLMNPDGTAKGSTKIASNTNGGPTLVDGDAFGFSVTSVGDLDGDGVDDLAVGAYHDDTGGSNRGAVHVLLLNSDGSVKGSSKIASGTDGGPALPDNGVFGSALTSVADLNGDGTTDLAVGAFLDSTGGSARGAVYVLLMNELQFAGPGDVTLPGAGSYELLLDGADTVVRVAGGGELFRQNSSLVTSLTINGSAGDDSLAIDFSNGNPIPSGGVSFDGVGQSSGDSLSLLNGSASTATYQFDNANDGSIVVDGQTITYTGLEPIFDDLTVADRVFTFGSGADVVTLSDDGAVGNGRSRIAAPGSGETVDFINPTNSLTINAGDGDDTLTLLAADSLLDATIAANGEAGEDVFVVTPQTASAITVDGGTPTSVAGPLDRLSVDLLGVDTPQLTVQPDGGGVLTSTTHASVTGMNLHAVSVTQGQYELIIDTAVLGEEDGAADEISLQLVNYDLLPVAIGDTSSPDPFLQFFDAPAINNEGQAAFLGLRSGMPENLQGVFVADTDGFVTAGLEGQTFADGTFTTSFSEVSLADSGLAAFRATIELTGMPGMFGGGVFGGDGSSITTIGPVADNPFAGPNFGPGAISENGTAVLTGGISFGEDLYLSTGSPVLLYDSSTLGPDIGAFFGPDVNNSGVIASVAGASPGVFRFVVTGNEGGLTTVADASDMAFGLRNNSISTNTSINDSGTVTFVARADTMDGEYGVYTGNGGALSLVADTTGEFGLFSSYGPSINDSGTVAFTAILKNGNRGLFTGPDVLADKVVVVGDLLAGASVDYVESGRFALNDFGEITFFASLDDGREAIAIADPITPHLQVAVNGQPVFLGEFSGISSITVNGSGDDDDLNVDTSAGDPIPDGGLAFNGGGQTGAGDALELNGPADTVTHTFISSSSGSADVDGQVINYTGLEPIVDMTTAAHRVFTFGATDDDVELSDGQFSNDGLFRLTSVASSELLDFSLPTTSLTINLGGGADSLLISVEDLDGFAGMVTFNGDAGADSIDASLLTLPVSINGGDDDDILSGGSGDDTIDGGNGSDVIVQAGDTDFTLTSTQLVSTLTGTDSLTSIDRAQLTGGVSDNTLDASAFGGSTTLTGGDGNDTLTGSAFADNLTGNGGDDLIIGGDGNDTLNGGSGKDELIGGAGDDLVQGQGSTGDTLEGGDGDDTLDGGSGNDLIRETFSGDATLTNSAMTGRGNDTVISAERAILIGSGASQSIDVGAFFTVDLTSVTLDGGSGDDTLVGSDGSDVLNGAGGSDVLDGRGGNDRMFGGAGADTLLGGTGDDLLKGLGGTGDRLSGGDGDDTINGGRGVDRIFETGDVNFTLTNTSLTGLGTDVVQAIEVAELNGGPSDNVIDVSTFSGFKGFTLLRGNGGNDSIIGSAMSDVINGGDGNDTLLGKGGDDTLNGEDGNDGLSGYTGNDVIDGGRGYDRGFGGEGNDTLLGGNAIDTLIGGNGDDSINGNDGIDTLVGGTGNNDASPGDVITDATANIDEAFMLDPLPDWVDQV